MKYKNLLQAKINQATVKPSDKIWQKIENGLQKEDKIRILKRRSVMGWAAAALILVLAYLAGKQEMSTPTYYPETLELNDQAGEVQLQMDFYPLNNSKYYRSNGRLVPNYHAIWEHPLVPRM